MNTLQQKLNNLKEVAAELQKTKRYNNNYNHSFFIDDTQGGTYETGLRKTDKNSVSIYLISFIVSIYKYKTHELESILKNKKCYIISKKHKRNSYKERYLRLLYNNLI
jgi:hypothetical protein